MMQACSAHAKLSGSLGDVRTYVREEFDGQKYLDLAVRRCLVENDLLLGGTRRHDRQPDPKLAQRIVTSRRFDAMYLILSHAAEQPLGTTKTPSSTDIHSRSRELP